MGESKNKTRGPKFKPEEQTQSGHKGITKELKTDYFSRYIAVSTIKQWWQPTKITPINLKSFLHWMLGFGVCGSLQVAFHFRFHLGLSCQGSSYSLLGIGMKIIMNKVSFLMPHLHNKKKSIPIHVHIKLAEIFQCSGGHIIYSNIALQKCAEYHRNFFKKINCKVIKLIHKDSKTQEKNHAFPETEDDNQNVGWDYIKKKKQKKKLKLFTQDNLSFFSFLLFCLFLRIYLGVYLCYGPS